MSHYSFLIGYSNLPIPKIWFAFTVIQRSPISSPLEFIFIKIWQVHCFKLTKHQKSTSIRATLKQTECNISEDFFNINSGLSKQPDSLETIIIKASLDIKSLNSETGYLKDTVKQYAKTESQRAIRNINSQEIHACWSRRRGIKNDSQRTKRRATFPRN